MRTDDDEDRAEDAGADTAPSQPAPPMPKWLADLSLDLDAPPQDAAQAPAARPVPAAAAPAGPSVSSTPVIAPTIVPAEPATSPTSPASSAALPPSAAQSAPPVLLKARAVDMAPESTPLHAQASEVVRRHTADALRNAGAPRGWRWLVPVLAVLAVAAGVAAWWLFGRG